MEKAGSPPYYSPEAHYRYGKEIIPRKEEESSSLSDKDSLHDALCMEKYLAERYNHFLMEVTDKHLFQDALRIHQTTLREIRGLHRLFFSKGYYQIERGNPL